MSNETHIKKKNKKNLNTAVPKKKKINNCNTKKKCLCSTNFIMNYAYFM